MKDEEMAEEYAEGLCKTCTFDTCRYNTLQTCAIKESLKQAYLAGLEAEIGKLRYCCTCKKWKECKVVSMYGICADWEIKE